MYHHKTSGLFSNPSRFAGKGLIWSIYLSLQIFALASITSAERISIKRKIKPKIFSILISLLLIKAVQSQTFHVQGNVSTDSTAVQNALVTFIDQSDRSISYSTLTDSLGNYQLDVITEISEEVTIVPQDVDLYQNYPNPFPSETLIPFNLNKQTNVILKIYNILGQEVRTFNLGNYVMGTHNLHWDGKDNFGNQVASGIYFYQLITAKESKIKKMLVMDGLTTSSSYSFGNHYSIDERMNKPQKANAGKMFTIEIKNGSSTNPWIKRKLVENVLIEQNTRLDFIVKEDILERYYLLIGSGTSIRVYDTELHAFVDSIGGFIKGVSDIEATKSGGKIYVCTGFVNAPGYVYVMNWMTKEKEIILSKRSEIFISPKGIPFIMASEPYDTLRRMGTIDTLTNAISWFDTLDIEDGGTSDQALVFDPSQPVFYSITNYNNVNGGLKLFKYNYETKEIIRYYNNSGFPLHRMTIDPSGKYIYFAGGPAIDLEKDSVVGDFRFALKDYNGSIAIDSRGTVLCTTDPGGYLIDPTPSGMVAVFRTLPQGFYSTNYNFIDLGHAEVGDLIAMTKDGVKAFVSDWIYEFNVIDLIDNIVSDSFQLPSIEGWINTILLLPKN
jgi:hypothetical protein